ncbi:hypothetical protein VTO73DRAFT_13150 [Trametes versicolor]
MIQLPSVDPYSFNPSQAEFAYAAVDDEERAAVNQRIVAQHEELGGEHAGRGRYGPSGGDADITRYSPDYGYVQMNEHLPQYAKKPL